jgi:hypothetical protein
VASTATYADSIRSCASKSNDERNKKVSCILKEIQLGRAKPPQLFPAAKFNNPKIFCYTIAGYPYPDTLPMVMNALSLGCDRWHTFSWRNLPIKETFLLFWASVMHAIKCASFHVISTISSKYNMQLPFDWVVKVNTDSFVQPSMAELQPCACTHLNR